MRAMLHALAVFVAVCFCRLFVRMCVCLFLLARCLRRAAPLVWCVSRHTTCAPMLICSMGSSEISLSMRMRCALDSVLAPCFNFHASICSDIDIDLHVDLRMQSACRCHRYLESLRERDGTFSTGFQLAAETRTMQTATRSDCIMCAHINTHMCSSSTHVRCMHIRNAITDQSLYGCCACLVCMCLHVPLHALLHVVMRCFGMCGLLCLVCSVLDACIWCAA